MVWDLAKEKQTMPFGFTKDDFKKAQKCPPGMHLATLTEVEDEYMNEKGTNIQKANFETDNGYIVPYWFNDKMPGPVFEFIGAADNITITEDNMPERINIKDYLHKRVAISVSHVKDKNNKIQAQIDNFFSADKVPF